MRWPVLDQVSQRPRSSLPAASAPDADIRDTAAAYLETLGVAAEIETGARGHMGKILVRLCNQAGLIKLALNERARQQLLAEARGYAEAPPSPSYRRPTFRLLHDDQGWAAALVEDLPIRRYARHEALGRRPGPFETERAGTASAGDLLRYAVDGAASGRIRDRLVARWGERQVPCAPSHGDFIYWNLGQLPDGRPALFDLEYYAPVRSRHFDRFFWSFVPLCRQAASRPWISGAVLSAAPGLARRVSPDGADGLALMLGEHASIMDRENHLPDAATLYDPVTLRLRRRQVAFYERLVDGLVR